MKTMYLVALLFLLTIINGLSSDIARELNFSFDGKHYTCIVSNSLIDFSPEWSEKDPTPPLPPRRALVLANKYVNKLIPESSNWTVHSIILAKSSQDRWTYEVEFNAAGATGAYSGGFPYFRIIVLMNEYVVPYSVVQEQ